MGSPFSSGRVRELDGAHLLANGSVVGERAITPRRLACARILGRDSKHVLEVAPARLSSEFCPRRAFVVLNFRSVSCSTTGGRVFAATVCHCKELRHGADLRRGPICVRPDTDSTTAASLSSAALRRCGLIIRRFRSFRESGEMILSALLCSAVGRRSDGYAMPV